MKLWWFKPGSSHPTCWSSSGCIVKSKSIYVEEFMVTPVGTFTICVKPYSAITIPSLQASEFGGNRSQFKSPITTAGFPTCTACSIITAILSIHSALASGSLINRQLPLVQLHLIHRASILPSYNLALLTAFTIHETSSGCHCMLLCQHR